MILVVGEALVDLVLRPGAAQAEVHPGGSPANVALGLARLGVPVALQTLLGDDEHGRLIADHLERSGVRLQPGSVDARRRTSRALARLDERGVATYEFDIDWSPGPLALGDDDIECLHTGSLATALAPGAGDVVALMTAADAAGVTVSYDPNVRPRLVEDRAAAALDVDRLVGVAHVVKVSEDDLTFLYPEESYAEVARRWVSTRSTPDLVVVTRGGDGAFAVSTLAETEERSPVDITLVDTVGAGDAFTSGLLDALRRADLLAHARTAERRRLGMAELGSLLREAMLVSAITCSRPGADPPTRAEVDALATGLPTG